MQLKENFVVLLLCAYNKQMNKILLIIERCVFCLYFLHYYIISFILNNSLKVLRNFFNLKIRIHICIHIRICITNSMKSKLNMSEKSMEKGISCQI